MRPLISILLIGLAGALPVAHAASPPTSVQATQGKFPTTVRITWNAVAGAKYRNGHRQWRKPSFVRRLGDEQ
ncbi:MAG: hypothetical protein B6247_23295 [Candidatus Parabeggiatoa sp. nov. 2]|nr:MAG: hypothetical protein B6247_23295 [Beggiatoa sp. 4572_84]